MSAQSIVLAVIVVCLAVGAVLVFLRLLRGPTILDRMIASDVLLTTMMIALGTGMAVTRRTDFLPVLLVLAAVASYGTIAVARNVSKHDASAERDADGADPDGADPDRADPERPGGAGAADTDRLGPGA